MSTQPIIGIYKITSPTGKIYVGQSIDIERRFLYYKRCYIKTQPKLLSSLKKHGVQSHLFEIIHVCEEKELNTWEVHFINLYQCFNTLNGLNLRSGGEGSGKMSDETKNKIAISRIGKKRLPFSEESKEKMRQSQYGRKHSEATKLKMSLWQKGVKKQPTSEETRQKISRANKGKAKSELYKMNHKHRLGKKMSDETKIKISQANKGRKWNEDQKQRHSVLIKKRYENRNTAISNVEI